MCCSFSLAVIWLVHIVWRLHCSVSHCSLSLFPSLSPLCLSLFPHQPPDVNHKSTFIWLMLHFRILITSPLHSTRSLKVNSLQKSTAIASTFQITDCTAAWRCDRPEGSTLQTWSQLDQKTFKALFMKSYLTFSILSAVALSHRLQWMTTDQTIAMGPLHCYFLPISPCVLACTALYTQLVWNSC